jgi:hypothetical protein
MPLDDVYIHFQYARAIAEGHPYAYNPGLPLTSGATSFLYPYALAAGYSIGFRDLRLGIWAMALGAAAFTGAIFLVYRIGRLRAPFSVALLVAAAFAVSGVYAWHAMSGMETLLAVCFSLALFYGVADGRAQWTAAGGVLLALTRPEGAVGALLAAAALLAGLRSQAIRDAPAVRPRVVWLLPLLAIAVQPIVNLAITGSLTASGSQAKSLLSTIASLESIGLAFKLQLLRFWRELLLPPAEPPYGVVLISALAVIGLLLPALRRLPSRFAGRSGLPEAAAWKSTAIALAWLAGGSLLISTLDTAFWHFKRYQMPFLALVFPLAAWGAGWIDARLRSRPSARPAPMQTVDRLRSLIVPALVAVMGIGLAAGWPTWLSAYALNVGYIHAQPYAMALWLRDHTAPDAVIAVHDVGMMRYVGERTTLDMVGLTTPGAALYWRNGPGAVGAFLTRERPDLIAAYGEGHGLGLGYLARTDLYAEPLALFSMTADPLYNVAVAAPAQGIYQPDWAAADAARAPRQASLSGDLAGLTPIDYINVADILDEQAHGYQWRSDRPALGFPTEFYQFAALDCAADCLLMDGGRRINSEEIFTLRTRPGEPVILVTRVHAGHAGDVDVFVGERLVATHVLPYLPGSWLEIATYIPAAQVTQDALTVRVLPRLTEGDYMPYAHWAYQGADAGGDLLGAVPAAYARYQDSRILLTGARLRRPAPHQLDVEVTWWSDGTARGDWIAFVHLYPPDDLGRVVAQTDRRPGNGTLPPGNWLPGAVTDVFQVDLSNVAAGTYRVAVGFYDPQTFERLLPTLTADAPAGYDATADGRLFIGTVTR